MRGIAAFFVVLLHAGLTKYIFFSYALQVGLIFSPVRIFFLISGFLIPMSIAKYGIQNFLISRIFRLIPVMLFIDLLIFADIRAIVLSVTSLFNWFQKSPVSHVYWSLEIEYIFYLFFTLSCVIYRKVNTINVCITILLIVTIYIISSIIQLQTSTILLSHYLNSITFLMSGSVFYFFHLHTKRYIKYVLALFTVLLSCFFAIIFSQNGINFNIEENLNKVYQILLFANWGPALKYWLLESCAIIPFFIGYKFLKFNNSILSFLGNISYPLYLIHTHILKVLDFNILTKLLAIVISIFLSHLIHKFIEVPMVSYGKKMLKA